MIRLLAVDDSALIRRLLTEIFSGHPDIAVTFARSGAEALVVMKELKPDVIFLDFLLREMTAFDVLDDLKSDPRTRSIPVIVVTSHVLDGDERARLARDTESIVSKETLSRELAINRIRDALSKAGVGKDVPRGDH